MKGMEIRPWICAALMYEGGPATVERLSRIIPKHPEPHYVSQQVYELKKQGMVEKIGVGSNGKPNWRLTKKFLSSNDIADMVPLVEMAAKEKVVLYSDLDAVRAEILNCLREPYLGKDRNLGLTKKEILAQCPSAITEHEVSQILAEFVGKKRIIAEGSGPRRSYWAAKDRQIDLNRNLDTSEATLTHEQDLIRIFFQEGAAARHRSAINGAITASYDRRGQCLEIVINKEILHAGKTD